MTENPLLETAGFINIRNVSKAFGSVKAVDDVSLDIARGQFFCLLGPSGCGKTTLMRMLAGFEQPDSGSLAIAGDDMAGIAPYDRPVNMMFQSYALFPHMSVRNNIAFGLKRMKLASSHVSRRTGDMLSLVQLDGLADRMPDQLSGGQKQRVALARALARQPKVLLLDEPLGALDKTLRKETQTELKRIQTSLGTTFVVVTHDQEEAMALSDRIAVMKSGKIIQVGSPVELYQNPASRFVAGFLGGINWLDVTVISSSNGLAQVEGRDFGHQLSLPVTSNDMGDLKLTVRPEKLSLTAAKSEQVENQLPVSVVERTYLGAATSYTVRTASGAILQVDVPEASSENSFEPGDQALVGFKSTDARLLPP